MENDRIDPSQTPANKQPPGKEKGDTNQPIEEHNVPSASGGISKLQAPPAQAHKKKTNKKHRYTRDPGMFWVSLATLIVVGFYAWHAREQSIETGKAANAARDSAIAATNAVKVAKDTLDVQRKSIQKTLSEMKTQSKAMQIGSNAAKKSADVAEKTMIGTQRPWVSVRLALGTGLKFDEQGGNITIVFRTKNVGNSPAAGTHIDAKVVLGFGSKAAIVEQKAMLAAARKYGPPFAASSAGYMLFPGDEFTYRINFSISRAYIKKSQTEIVESFKRGNPDIPNIDNKFSWITPSIVGCVVYGFSFDESVHKTGFIGEIFRIDPLYPNGRSVIDPAAGDVPSNLLILEPSEFGSYAD